MSREELTVQVPFIRVRRGLAVTFQAAGVAGGPAGPPTPLAKCLARAYKLGRVLNETGPGALVREAKRQGLSPQRIARIHTLVYLAPRIQEAILLGTPEASRIGFLQAFGIAQHLLWADQYKIWAELVKGRGPQGHSEGTG